MLAGLAAEGVIAGLHAEGPFLSPARAGAQDPRHMLAPDLAVLDRLHTAARGQLRILTLAPELPGALPLIEAARQAGVTVAIGHTDATAAVTMTAIDAGASHATHLFNAMPPVHHRAPGAAGALLDRAEVTCELIADGVHLDDLALRLAFRAVGPGRLVLVSDAMAAAGRPDGRYRLGPVQVTVAGGVARLAPGSGEPGHPAAGAIAGSTATLADVVHRAVAAGLPVPAVAAAASTTPARVLGLRHQIGALEPGLAADLVICDGDGRTRVVIRQGRWLTPPVR
jgi:N-acetylglucosamine-6-phosphate deacetylase